MGSKGGALLSFLLYSHVGVSEALDEVVKNVYKNTFTQNNNHFIGEIKSNLVNMPQTNGCTGIVG